MNSREKFLNEVRTIVCSDRNAAYGEPEDNFADIAAHLNIRFMGGPSPLFLRPIRPAEVTDILSFVKQARRKTSPHHLDHLLDLAGYAACGYACEVREIEQEQAPKAQKRYSSVPIIDAADDI